MTTDLAVRDASAPLALRPGQMIFDDLQQKALAAMGVKNATKADLAVYAHVCHRTRLDPFTRQIHMIERREKNAAGQWVSKQTIQTGIDGFRVIRDRAAAEQHCEVELEETIWYDADGGQHTEWIADDAPAGCKVVLIKHTEKGRALRYPAFLRTASYVQLKDGKPVSQWRQQPEHMIEKCCEAFACRRAFPQDFSGLYIEEEMIGRAGDESDRPAARKVTAADIMQQPAPDDEVAEGEFVDEADEDAGHQHEQPAQPARVVTAQEVNDHFKRLGLTVRDKKEVLHAAAVLSGRKLLDQLGDLTAEQLAAVASALEGVADRGELVALLAERSDKPGDGDAAAAERAFKAGDTNG